MQNKTKKAVNINMLCSYQTGERFFVHEPVTNLDGLRESTLLVSRDQRKNAVVSLSAPAVSLACLP